MRSILTDWETLTHDHIRRIIADNIEEDPATFAIRQAQGDFPYALMATQLKYLQRARQKLPSWYQVQAIIPPLAYEQSSSEVAASLKPLVGKRGLDLTLGLGVDAHAFSQQTQVLIGLETQATLADIVRYNYTLLGQTQVDVQNTRAEDFVRSYDGPRFDWIYADPARRDQQGKRVHALNQGQPNLLSLWPSLGRMAQQLWLKASPLLDLQAATRIVPGLGKIRVHSINREVKEVLLASDLSTQSYIEPKDIPLEIVLHNGQKTQQFSLHTWSHAATSDSMLQEPSFLAEPDPAFYQAHCLPALHREYLTPWTAQLPHPMGYWLADSPPPHPFPGRVFSIREQWPYKPKNLKKSLKARGIRQAHVMRRAFPQTVAQIRQQLQLAEGGSQYLICSSWQGQKWALLAETISADSAE